MWILRLKVFTGHPFLQWVVTWVPVDKIVRNSLSLYQVFRLWGQQEKMWTGKKTVRGFSCMPNSCHFSPSERSQKLSEHLYRAANLLEVTTCHYKGNNILEIYRILHGRLKIRNFSLSVEKCLKSERSKQVKYFSTLEEKFCIFKWPCNVLFIV